MARLASRYDPNMTSVATVVYVMIASPSDVAVAREAVYTAIGRWNEANAQARGIVLVPLRWETGAVPMLGEHPQSIINRQLLDRADALIALFGSRLGAATQSASSGTAEEIDVAMRGGKPVHLYFSTAPRPHDIDPSQLLALNQFRTELEGRGLYGTFGSVEELTAHVWQAIEHDIAHSDWSLGGARENAVPIVVQGGSERVQESDPRGRLRSRLHRWVDVINRSDADLSGFEVEPLGQGVHFYLGDGRRTLHAGQSQRFPYDLSLSASSDLRVRVSWDGASERVSREFDV